MKTKFVNFKSILVITMLMCYSSTKAAVIIPSSITYGSCKDGNYLKLLLSFYIVLNFISILGLFVRYFFIIKNKNFGNQSKIKNLFFDFKENTFYGEENPLLNIFSFCLILLNSLALVLCSVMYIYSIL